MLTSETITSDPACNNYNGTLGYTYDVVGNRRTVAELGGRGVS